MSKNENASGGNGTGSHHGFRKFLKILLLLILALALAAYIIPLTETVSESELRAADSENWMGKLDGGMPLSDLVIPGTHDSATQYVRLAFFFKCQAASIRQQLEAGYRYLDIRLELKEDRFRLIHGFASCGTGALPWADRLYLEDVLEQCYGFLEANPTETVLFAVKQEHGDASVAEFETALAAVVRQNPDRWLLTDRIPTLDEARGKLVLLRRYEDAAGLGAESGVPMLWPDQKGHEDVSRNLEMIDNGSYQLYVQDRFEYSAEDKWAAFTAGLNGQPAQSGSALFLHFLSTRGSVSLLGHPYHFAKILNAKLAELPASALNGWIVVDFATAPLAEHIYSSNFR